MEARRRGASEGHRRRARLAQRLRGRARRGRRAQRVRGRGAGRGVPLRGAARHGRLQPRARGRCTPCSARVPATSSCTCSTPPIRPPCAAVEAAVDLETHAVRGRQQVRRHHRDGVLPRLLLRAPVRARRRARRPPLRGDHRRGHVARAGGPRPGLPRHLREPGDIGGRYSALSFFGMVPAALMGVDLDALPGRRARRGRGLRAGRAAARRTRPCASAPPSASWRGAAATSSRSCSSGALAPLGAWVEQLVAESTGKEGTRHPAGGPRAARRARALRRRPRVQRGPAGRPARRRPRRSAWRRSARPATPCSSTSSTTRYDLGGEFLRWEIAVAAAGHVLGIDPFDQPNVQESKDITKGLLAEYEATGELPAEAPGDDGRRLAFPVGDDGLPAALRAFLAQAAAGDYVALQAYVAPDDGRLGPAAGGPPAAARRPHRGHDARLRPALPALHRAAPQGRSRPGFVPAAPGARPRRCRYPGPAVQLRRAQARPGARRPGGALRAHGRRALRVCLGDDVPAGLTRLAGLVAALRLEPPTYPPDRHGRPGRTRRS